MRGVAASLVLALALVLAATPLEAQNGTDPSPEQPAQGTIETVHLDGHARLMGTTCNPTRVSFSGRIVTDGPAFVTYRWLRSDGVRKDGVVQFEKAAGRSVATSWDQTSSYSGWVQLVVLTPKRVETQKTHFSVHCGTS